MASPLYARVTSRTPVDRDCCTQHIVFSLIPVAIYDRQVLGVMSALVALAAALPQHYGGYGGGNAGGHDQGHKELYDYYVSCVFSQSPVGISARQNRLRQQS